MRDRTVAYVWWIVRVTSLTEQGSKLYGPFKHEGLAQKFADQFDPQRTTASALPLTPPPNRPHKMDPNMRGFRPLPPTQKPRPRKQI